MPKLKRIAGRREMNNCLNNVGCIPKVVATHGT